MPYDRNPIRRGSDGRIHDIDVKALLDRPDGFGTLRDALQELRADLPEPRNRQDAPPWELCPVMPRHSVGWRMGGGERMIGDFRQWFRALSPQERLDFCVAHPEPPEWEGFYASLA